MFVLSRIANPSKRAVCMIVRCSRSEVLHSKMLQSSNLAFRIATLTRRFRFESKKKFEFLSLLHPVYVFRFQFVSSIIRSAGVLNCPAPISLTVSLPVENRLCGPPLQISLLCYKSKQGIANLPPNLGVEKRKGNKE